MIKNILRLIEPKTLMASILPVTLGSIISLSIYRKFSLKYFTILILGVCCIQSAINIINDYVDYKSGSDEEKNEEKVLAAGEITPILALVISGVLALIALCCGVYMAGRTSTYIILVGFIGGMVGVLYSVGPFPISFTPFGEIASGSVMGILLPTTVMYLHSGRVVLYDMVLFIPTALYIGGIMFSNNIGDIEKDRDAGRKTLPIILGKIMSIKLWKHNMRAIMIIAILLCITGRYPWVILLIVFITFPHKEWKAFKRLNKDKLTKGALMGMINKVGIRYHGSVVLGLVIDMHL